MINPTKKIETTATYVPPFIWHTYGYQDTDFFVTTGSLNEMYIRKYDVNDWVYMLHPFKAVIL